MVDANYLEKLSKVCSLLYFDNISIYRNKEHFLSARQTTAVSLSNIYENVKCKVSYKNSNSTVSSSSVKFTETASVDENRIKIFLDTEYKILVGDVLLVMKNDETYKYMVSTNPSVYFSHQEFIAVLLEGDIND